MQSIAVFFYFSMPYFVSFVNRHQLYYRLYVCKQQDFLKYCGWTLMKLLTLAYVSIKLLRTD